MANYLHITGIQQKQKRIVRKSVGRDTNVLSSTLKLADTFFGGPIGVRFL